MATIYTQSRGYTYTRKENGCSKCELTRSHLSRSLSPYEVKGLSLALISIVSQLYTRAVVYMVECYKSFSSRNSLLRDLLFHTINRERNSHFFCISFSLIFTCRPVLLHCHTYCKRHIRFFLRIYKRQFHFWTLIFIYSLYNPTRNENKRRKIQVFSQLFFLGSSASLLPPPCRTSCWNLEKVCSHTNT
jgi:hypothetical protein